MKFFPCRRCGETRPVCSLAVLRFRTHCPECGHSAACHRDRHWLSTIVFVAVVAATCAIAARMASHQSRVEAANPPPAITGYAVRHSLTFADSSGANQNSSQASARQQDRDGASSDQAM